MSEHRCHVPGCSISIPPRLLMCYRHWRQVPYELQRAVWDHYVPGQETRKDPSEGWIQAAQAAINAVSS